MTLILTESLLHALILFTTFLSSAALPQTFWRAQRFVIDKFDSTATNALGWYHGSDFDGFEITSTMNGTRFLNVSTNDTDASFSTSLGSGCSNMIPYLNSYLHITFGGSSKFTVSLQQHNQLCDDNKVPSPQTWDSIEAARYANNLTDLFVPLSHFTVDLAKAKAIVLEGFYTSEPTWFFDIEFTNYVFPTTRIPPKLHTGTLRSTCTRPGLLAFGIDDGIPELAQETMQIIQDEEIPVTFFSVSEALLDGEANFTRVYREMLSLGHQVGLHTFDHPRMEALRDDRSIDLQMTQSINVMSKQLHINSTYFRPPFGTVGARTRQSIGRYITNAKIVLWSIDVEDWKWGMSETPEKQLAVFKQRLDEGGDIVVMHYLYPSTVRLFPDMIRYAKSQGRQMVRMDQCFGDPRAPRTWNWKG